MEASTAALIATLFVSTVLADFDYKEGVVRPGDVLVADCLYDHMGTRGAAFTWPINFLAAAFSPGTTFTAIDVVNLKTTFRANIFKVDGGLGKNFVKFSMVTAMDHGAKFQYKLWAKVTTPNPIKITGYCIKSQGRR